MKTAKLIELERKSADLRAACRDALHAIGEGIESNTVDEQRKLEREHDKLMNEWELVQLDIADERANATDAEAREARRPGASGTAFGTDDGSASYGDSYDWTDKRGNPVRVVGRGGSISERRHTGPSVGDLIRAKIAGPRNEAEERALSEGTDSAGGYTVPTPLASDFIDLMRARSVAIRAGAMTVPMDSASLSMARLASDPTVAWRAENAAIAEGDPTFERVLFEAKTIAGKVTLSRELADDSINIGRMIQTALAGAMAVELDKAAIYGDGTSDAPTGVWHTSGINAVSMGTNGAAFTAGYDEILDAILELKNDNAADPTAMIANPRTEIALAKLKDADSNPLTVPGLVSRIPLLSTTSAPVDETEGTATNASSIVLGDFTQLMIGMRQQLEIRVFDHTMTSNGQLTVLAWMRADTQLAQPKSFAKLTGIIPA
ncbi:phage major capsid protein, HK97 family [Erythrobacter litoralis]|uniref:Phage capsid-like C-terminal domain-containing protein n=2 Tax=Erythrobacter litoralis TaxID=39960 RepID=A0A074MYL0_9SPHN|nr:phage major capsid protein, HK97 family [Erythrobacter litoralis]KEO98544.1 hypothetical protein EH32_05395 [Erythrobacter litoralis]